MRARGEGGAGARGGSDARVEVVRLVKWVVCTQWIKCDEDVNNRRTEPHLSPGCSNETARVKEVRSRAKI